MFQTKSTQMNGAGSAAAIWSLADIAYIAIYRDMSKISRYNIAIFLSIFIEQLLTINHTIFMRVEAVLLWWRHENKRIKCYMAREGGGGGRRKGGGGGGGGVRRDTVPIGIHILVYMNRVLPK